MKNFEGDDIFNTDKFLKINLELVKLIGFENSIVLQQIYYWLCKNKEKKINFFESKYWVYGSIKNWSENEFWFWSETKVKRIFSFLLENNFLIKGNFNKKFRTNWYTIDFEKIKIDFEKETEKGVLGQNEPLGQNDLNYWVKMNQSIGSNWTNALGQNDPILKRINKEINKRDIIINQSINHNNKTNKVNELTVNTKSDWLIDLLNNKISDSDFKDSDKEILDNIKNIIYEICICESGTRKIEGHDVNVKLIQKRFRKLDSDKVLSVIKAIRRTEKISNIKAFTITSLYNSVTTSNMMLENEIGYLLD